jgi:phage tail sheath gpL-like
MAISTAVPAGAIARAVGVDIKNVNLRTGMTMLPNQVAVIGQAISGAVGVKFNKKQVITSASEAGTKYGYGSPLHLMCLQLFPRSGDGVTADIPVNVYPLDAPKQAQIATGSYEITGLSTVSAVARIEIGNKYANAVIKKGDTAETIIESIKEAIDSNVNMPVLTETVLGIPPTNAFLGGRSLPDSPTTLTAINYQVLLTVDGQPLTVTVDLSNANTELQVADALQTAINNAGGRVTALWEHGNARYVITTITAGSKGSITSLSDSGSGTTGLSAALHLDSAQSSVTPGEDEIPSKVNITAKWAGVTGNDIKLSVELEECGVMFVINDMKGGLLNPDVDLALNSFKDIWNSIVVNQFGRDNDTFNKLSDFCESRWDGLVGLPFAAVYGDNNESRDELILPAVNREEDRTNVCIPVYGSKSLPFEIAARASGLIVSRAQSNSPRPYIGMAMTGIDGGEDEQQLEYTDRNYLEVNGISTTLTKSGVPVLQDVMTFYRPEGEPDPGFKYVVDLFKSFNWLFNLKLLFSSDKWEGVILVNNEDIVSNEWARKPSTAVVDIHGLIDSFADNAIIVNRDYAKQNCKAEIDPKNPNRLNTKTVVKYSGAGRISSNTLAFGFNVN